MDERMKPDMSDVDEGGTASLYNEMTQHLREKAAQKASSVLAEQRVKAWKADLAAKSQTGAFFMSTGGFVVCGCVPSSSCEPMGGYG